LTTRYLGCGAVIARSFARTHETNLKKQGLLPLTFSDMDDYDRILEDDRISLLRLGGITAGIPVECRITHTDGSLDTLLLHHTFNDSQLAWFKQGSALNVLRMKSYVQES
jgi:aconitate hydratase